MHSQSKVYNVMPGEPHLGRVRETTYTFSREEIIEAMAITFLEEECTINSEFELGGEYYTMGTYLDSKEVESINDAIIAITDAEWRHNKPFTTATTLLESLVPLNAEIEQDAQEYL